MQDNPRRPGIATPLDCGRHAAAALLLATTLAGCTTTNPRTSMTASGPNASIHDQQRAAVPAAREADWRNGAIVYQVIVDRFAPPANLDAKRNLYPPPKRLREWTDRPTAGDYVPTANVYQHEIDFWGGGLASLRGKLAYSHDLGADALYLNPIHDVYTNHMYDALDYFAVSPEYGTRADVQALAADCHARGRRLVLAGGSNPTGARAAGVRGSPQHRESLHRAPS